MEIFFSSHIFLFMRKFFISFIKTQNLISVFFSLLHIKINKTIMNRLESVNFYLKSRCVLVIDVVVRDMGSRNRKEKNV